MPNPKSAAPRQLPRRILLTEDTPLNQAFLLHELRRKGFEVATAENGAEALHKLQEGGFDLVLMDIQMPGMDGIEATRRIREGMVKGISSDLPVIALTAYALEEDRRKLLASGMHGYCAEGDTAAASRIAHTLCGLVGVIDLRSLVADFRILEQTLRREDLAEGKRRYEEAKVLLRTVTTRIQNLPLVRSANIPQV